MPPSKNKLCPWCHKPLTLAPSEYLAICEALGLTQREIAAKLGVKASHIAYLENGRRYPSPMLLGKIIKLAATAKGRKRKRTAGREASR
jgi:transcriptional regulator with XRE-family HTH domain